jgi:hypothetical protein
MSGVSYPVLQRYVKDRRAQILAETGRAAAKVFILCAAIVDRLTFGGNIIETGTDSYQPHPLVGRISLRSYCGGHCSRWRLPPQAAPCARQRALYPPQHLDDRRA